MYAYPRRGSEKIPTPPHPMIPFLNILHPHTFFIVLTKVESSATVPLSNVFRLYCPIVAAADDVVTMLYDDSKSLTELV